MSKNINVNPGQYHVAGRERMGENMNQDHDKGSLTKEKARQRRSASRPPAPRKRTKKGKS